MDEFFVQTRALFESLASTYATRKRSAEAVATRHEYYTVPAHDIRPLHFERSGATPGRKCNAERAHASVAGVMVGVDGTGRVAFGRQYNPYGFYETFYEWEAAVTTSCHYDYSAEKAPINVTRVQLREGRPYQAVACGVQGCSVETYRYENGLLAIVSLAHAARTAGVVAQLSPLRRETLSYDSEGRLARVTWADLVSTEAGIRMRPEWPVYERRGRRIWRRGP